MRDHVGRAWFACPECGRRCEHLYLDELQCRTCLHLDYASRHLHRSVPMVRRIMRWRRQIGADPRPFSPIARQPRARHRIHEIIRRIYAAEAALVGRLAEINDDLEQRRESLTPKPS